MSDHFNDRLLSKYLAIVDATSWSLADNGEPQVASSLHSRLRMLAELLTSAADEARKQPSSAASVNVSAPLAPGEIHPW